MSESEKTLIYVLLPLCVELETDVFLNLLRIGVARTSLLDDHRFDHVKDGITADTLYIKSNDLLVNWKNLNSDSQRIRQMKMLGVWMMYNYPSLAKKLMGERWQTSGKKTVQVIGHSKKSVEELNDVILKKMKLRIVELNVCYGTLAKMKHFVEVPIDIGRFNGIRISASITLFEIDNADIENCWKAMKSGSYVNKKQLIAPLKETPKQNEQGVNILGGPKLIPVAKRLRLDVTTRVERGEKESSPTDGSQLIHLHSAEASRIDTIKGSTTESIRTEVVEMRKEMGDISKLCHSARHSNDRSESEISQLKSDVANLLKENEVLNGHIERNASLTNALQKGLDSSSKLNGMLESQLQVLIEKLTEAQKVGLEMTEKNAKLEQDLLQSKNYAATLHAQSEIDGLITRLSDAENLNIVLSDKNVKLKRDLVESKQQVVIIEKNLESQTQDLTNKLSEVKLDLLKSKNCAASAETSLHNEIQDLINRLSETEKDKNELYNRNVKIEGDLIESINLAVTNEVNLKNRIQQLTEKLSEVEHDLLKSQNCAATVQASLQDKIKDLMKCLSEAENKKSDMSEQIRKLKVDLIGASKLKATLSSLNDYVNAIKAEFENSIKNFETSLAQAKKTELELITKNAKLEEDLNACRGNDLESVETLDKPEHKLDLESEDEDLDLKEDDPIVKEFSKNLKIVEFGWIKFLKTKNCTAVPGFVYPPDKKDGKQRAQRISPDGYVNNRKNLFVSFVPSIPDNEKDKTCVRMLNRFNGRFKTSYK